MFLIIFICFILEREINGMINLAFNKTTYSSPPYSNNYNSSKAVDGIIGKDGGSCFQASSARNGYLYVDLGKKFRIQRVVVHGRIDQDGSRLKNMVISMKHSAYDIYSSDKFEVCNRYGEVKNGEKMNFICENQFNENQFVFINENPQPNFYICEIEVYERELNNFGCFEDVDIIHSETDSNLDTCLHKCYNLSTTFAAVKNRKTCICSNEISRKKSSKSCDIPCEGSSSQFCGGSNAFSVYTVCSPGYYGKYCDKVCHCKDRTPCNRDGKCFDVCQPGWTGIKCDSITDDGSFQNVGCFDDKTTMEFGYADLKKCANNCVSYDFKYFGLKSNGNCYCFEEKEYRQSGDCRYYPVKVYQVCRPGSFGDFCLDTCHCLKGSCWKDNGTCQIQECQDGWKGPACNVRDCSVNNGDCGEYSKCQDEKDPFCFCDKEGYDEWRSCEDLDECSLGTSKCGNNSECQNIPGSYKCNCSSGLKNSDPITCEDIDECKMDVCETSSTDCHNTIGSFYCKCKNGFHSIDQSNTSCQDINECSFDNGGCDLETTNCSNTLGSFECFCKDVHLLLNSTNPQFQFCQVYVYSGSSNHWQIPAIVSVIVLLIVIIIVLGIILKMQHLRRLRKRFSNITGPIKEDEPLNEIMESTDISLVDLETYYKTHSSEIYKQFSGAPKHTSGECKYGANVELKPKNRFKNILPYDSNRVKLINPSSEETYSDYVNASYISEDGSDESAKYIAAQGPTDSSLEDFWLMVCQENVDVIVMLTMTYEEGKHKCSQYWPESEKAFTCGKISVSLESTQKWPHFFARKLSVMNKETGEARNVTHFLYTSWADKGVPDHIESLLHLRRKVVQTSRNKILVHCSAGVGRTGTFLAIHFLLNEAAKQGSVNFLQCLKSLRSQRPQMIQNVKQYLLCFQAVVLEYKIGNTSIPAQNVELFRKRLKDLNREDEDGMSLIRKQFHVLQEQMESLKPSNDHIFIAPNNSWQAYHFPGLKKASAFVAGVVDKDLTIIGLVNILSQSGSIALSFENSKDEGFLAALLPSKDEKINVEGQILQMKGVKNLENITKTTYELVVSVTGDNIYSNTMTSKEFSVIRVPNKFRTHAQMISIIWRLINEEQEHNHIFLLGNSHSEVGTFMAASNIFEMMDCYEEANIFQVALDLILVHPNVLDLVGYSILHALAEEHLLLKAENKLATRYEENKIYANS